MRSARLKWGALALVAVVAAAGVGAYYVIGSGIPSPPTVDVPTDDPELTDAVAVARRAVESEPRSAKAWGELGMLLATHRYDEAALTCFEQAEKLDPADRRWPYHQGLVLAGRDPAAAVEQIRRSADRGRSEPTRLRLAETLLTLGRLDEAEMNFREVTKAFPGQPRANLGLARIALDRGDLAGCEQFLKIAENDPQSRQGAAALMAELKHRQGDTPASMAARRRAAELPTDPPWPDPDQQELGKLKTGLEARTLMADRLLDTGRYAEAARALHDIIRDRPNSPRQRLQLGFALINMKEYAAAEKVLLPAAAGVEAPRAHYHIGVARLNLDRPAEAVESFRQAIALRPDYLAAHLALGDYLKKSGDRAGAVKAYRSAIAIRPDDPGPYLTAAELLIESNQKAEAAELLDQVLIVDPGLAQAKELLTGIRTKKSPN